MELRDFLLLSFDMQCPGCGALPSHRNPRAGLRARQRSVSSVHRLVLQTLGPETGRETNPCMLRLPLTAFNLEHAGTWLGANIWGAEGAAVHGSDPFR